MARRVKQSVMAQAAQASSAPKAVKQSVDLKKGAEFFLPTNQRSLVIHLFEFGLFFAAALAMWSVDMVISGVLFALAIGIPLLMYYYDGTKTPRSAFIDEDKIILKFRFGKPKTIFWDDIEYLQKIEVYETLSSRSKSIGWMKGTSMKTPVILSNKAGDVAIYAYTMKKGVPPPEKIVEKN
jgi:hypothetical protein